MKWAAIPISTLSVLLSVCLGIALWKLDVINPGPAIVAALLLELVLISHRMFARVGAFSRRMGQISSLPEMNDILLQVSELSRDRRRFSRLILNTIVRNFCNQTAQLRHGRQNLSPDQFMLIAKAVYESLSSSDTLMATSYFGGGDYWTTKYGAEYAALNRAAHARGAKIVRIYVVRDRQHFADKAALIKQQLIFSDVRVLMLDEITLANSEQRDFFVLNDQLAAEFHFSGGDIVSSIDVVLDPAIVNEMSALMQKLNGLSRPAQELLP